ncbi:hypothetical protein [Rhizobium sp. RU36D]|uniref:hypothetical protein n=1 Tax=Rhizobium sp. RU36D TaxID=1907415 RepID=UPI0009D7B0CB|nr:hypothetical protein [Rhizobium sp. RU36D]SMD14988.1 hypothetical protein SAMN05880593_12710 [Rhizobium sp. RU36D]
MNVSTVYYRDHNGIVVTDKYLRTKHKDQALAPITSIRIGREPLHLSLALGLGILLFAWRFGDLLYLHEQLAIAATACIFLTAGYSLASLQMGTYIHEKTMLWSSYWRVRKIRDAVIAARRNLGDQAESAFIVEDLDL